MEIKPKMGLSIEDVSKNPAFSKKGSPVGETVEIKKLTTPEFNNGIEVNGWRDIYKKSDIKTRDKMDKDINYLLKDKKNELEPILVKQDGKFLDVEDGHHRVASYLSAGRENIPIQTVKPTAFAPKKTAPKTVFGR